MGVTTARYVVGRVPSCSLSGHVGECRGPEQTSGGQCAETKPACFRTFDGLFGSMHGLGPRRYGRFPAEAVGEAPDFLDDEVDRFGAAVADPVGVERGQNVVLPRP
jgi:hypothetical protein